MRRLFGAIVLLALTVSLSAGVALAQKGDKKNNEPIDSSKLSGGEFTGTLKTKLDSDQIFTLTIETEVLVPTGKNNNNGGNVGRILQLQNEIGRTQMQMQRADNPRERMRAGQRLQQQYYDLQRQMAQLAGQQQQGYKVEKRKQDVEFQASDSAKIRTMVLPENFDDKGNVKKYTKEQLDELKGTDKKSPGYESAIEKLEAGAKVRLKLGPAPKAKGEKDEDDKKMQASLIVILEEAPVTQKGKGKK